MNKLDNSWKTVKENYKLVAVLGEGGGGQVVKARHRKTNKTRARASTPKAGC